MNGHTFHSVQIFRAGNYGEKGTFSVADLDAIVSDYSADRHEAPLTVDHKQDGPAYGWIKKLRRVGETLVADFGDVHPEFAAAIKSGAFKQRSAEIYRSFASTGRPYLKAVTMLGAAPPAVKGLEPIKFSSDAGESVELDAEPIAFEAFGEFPKPPEGAPSFGVLVSQSPAGDMGDHWHNAYMDAEKNGYTGPPRSYEYGADAHQHAVVAGVVQAAGDPPHTHTLTTYQTTGESAMSEKTETPPAAPAPQGRADDPAFAAFAAEFAEREKAMDARVKAAEDRAAKLEAERRDERESARFAAAFSEALKAGRVMPAERDALAFAFSALPHDDSEGVATFGESKLSPRAAFLASFSSRPASVAFGDALDRQSAKFGADPAPQSRDARMSAAIVEFGAKKGLDPAASFADASVIAEAERFVSAG